MTGRRLLDVVAIFKASRGVAAKHVALRQHQLDDYRKTSSLAKAIKSQTDRVSLTVKAASVLAERFNGRGPDYSTQASQSKRSPQGASIPSQDGASGKIEEKVGVSQDHFYERSHQNATAEPPPNSNLGVNQEKAKRYPLPDGSVLPADTAEVPKLDKESNSGFPQTEPVKAPLADGREETGEGLQSTPSGTSSIANPTEGTDPSISGKAKKLQRQAEKQIPSQFAETPPAAHSGEPGLEADQDRDVFYTLSPSDGQVDSSLPRVMLPKNTEDVQEGDEHVHDAQINQDVFYSSTSNSEEQAVPQTQALLEQEQASDEAYTELFHSPRVARMLRGQSQPSKPSKGLQMAGTQETPVKQTKPPQDKDQVSYSIRAPGQESHDGDQHPPTGVVNSMPSQARASEDAHDLAADMAKDAEAMSVDPSQLPNDLEAGQRRAPYEMQESRVPSSRFGRFWQYGGLATSMAFGAVGESLRRATGGGGNAGGSLMLSAGNMERLVAKLSRMRGAALKLGQMMSFQGRSPHTIYCPITHARKRFENAAGTDQPSSATSPR